MQANRMGILSAVLASVCCLGPVLLAMLGLGSLGLGAALGRYHWWFIGAAGALLAYAWHSYLTEARRCTAASCEMVGESTARTVLTLASGVVAALVGLNLYTYSGQSYASPPPTLLASQRHLTSAVIPVEGMTCFTCELTVESRLKSLPGVHSIDAKVKDATASIQYDSATVTVDELIATINQTGYRATRPKER